MTAAQIYQNNNNTIDIIEMYKKIEQMSRQIKILKQQKYGQDKNIGKRQ